MAPIEVESHEVKTVKARAVIHSNLIAIRLAAALTPLVFGGASLLAYPSQLLPKTPAFSVACMPTVHATASQSYTCKVTP